MNKGNGMDSKREEVQALMFAILSNSERINEAKQQSWSDAETLLAGILTPALASLQPVQEPVKPLGWVKTSELEHAQKFGGSVNLWLHCYRDTDKAVYAAPLPQSSRDQIRNEVLAKAANLFPQPHKEYFGLDIQDAIRALQSQPAGKDAEDARRNKVLLNALNDLRPLIWQRMGAEHIRERIQSILSRIPKECWGDEDKSAAMAQKENDRG